MELSLFKDNGNDRCLNKPKGQIEHEVSDKMFVESIV